MTAPASAVARGAGAATTSAAPGRASAGHDSASGNAGPADAFALLLDGLFAALPQAGAAADTAGTQPLAQAQDGEPAEATPAKPHGAHADPGAIPSALLQALALPLARASAPGPQGAATTKADTARTESKATAAAPPAKVEPAAPDLFAATAATATPATTPHPAAESFAAALASVDAAPVHKASETHAAADATLAASSLAAAAAAPMPVADAPAAAVHQAALPTHPLDAAFAGDLGAEVQWMVDAGVQHAQLHLNPAELGPIHVDLTLNAQTADISFAAAHAATREGLAQALPALRELLAGQGLQLGQAGISAGSGGQGGSGREPPPRAPRSDAAGAAGAVGATAAAGAGGARRSGTMTLRGGSGMLDLYA